MILGAHQKFVVFIRTSTNTSKQFPLGIIGLWRKRSSHHRQRRRANLPRVAPCGATRI
jgi:hypothetical protein